MAAVDGEPAVTDPAAQPARSGVTAFLVGLGIFLSRVAGLIRERVLATYFGTGLHADVFAAGMRLPNVLQNLLGEGTLSASFIPAYSALLGQGRTQEAGRVAGATFALLLAVAGAISLLGVLFVDMWSWWGYLTVIYFAALRQVDRSLIEAALVDGASRWQTFWHVLRPSILPTVMFMLLMSVIWSFRVFDWIFVLTEGGPGFSSEVLATLAYKTAFQSFEVGRASAYSLSMSLLGLAAIVIYLRLQARREKV